MKSVTTKSPNQEFANEEKSKAPIPIDKKLACSISETAELSGVCRTLIYEEIKDGRLIARKVRDRTIILRTDREAWLAALPRGVTPQKEGLKRGKQSRQLSSQATV